LTPEHPDYAESMTFLAFDDKRAGLLARSVAVRQQFGPILFKTRPFPQAGTAVQKMKLD
jgi:hypothetical protein